MTNTYHVLVVDDEINSLKVISAALTGEEFVVETALSAEEALSKLKQKTFHLIISDYKMPGMSGEKLLEKTKTLFPDIPFILLTAFGTIELAVEAMRKGAYTYLTKPVKLDLLEPTVRDALLRQEVIDIEKERYLNIIGKSSPMREMFTLIKRVSKTDANILILGESGTGKELVARAIHYDSLRADKPFIPIDCTTIPSELMESELFGYEKGAFSGAEARKIGLIEMARGGTVFFDEIGDLNYALQKKLLRFIQEKEIQRVGGQEKIKTAVRILAATNRNIEEAVEKGEFRSDLYYRLNVIIIRTPPLRERKEDIPLIAGHYLKHFSRKSRKGIMDFDREVMKAFMDYDWPGNVRELENVVERAVILCPYETVNMECLPRKFKAREEEEEEGKWQEDLNLPEIEKQIIRKALDKTTWNQSKAAELLGITRKQLRTKMKNLGFL